MNVESAIAAFASDDIEVPHEALRWTLDHWREAAPRLLGLLERYADGTDRSPRAANSLLCIVHLAGEMREARAFAPLCRLALDGKAIEEALGDVITEGLANILIGVYDGDLPAVKRVIEAADADEFVRDAFFRVLAYLTASGRVPRDETEAYLRTLYDDLRPQETSFVWDSWAIAIAMLGLDALSGFVHSAFERGLIDPTGMSEDDFRSDLQRALGAPDPLAPFEEDRLGPLDDAVAELSRWYAYLQASEQYGDEEPGEMAGSWLDEPLQEPAVNPYRGVGRNDPCPCGSGRKFKKCCLPRLGAEE